MMEQFDELVKLASSLGKPELQRIDRQIEALMTLRLLVPGADQVVPSWAKDDGGEEPAAFGKVTGSHQPTVAVSPDKAPSQLIRDAISSLPGTFTLKDVAAILPGLSGSILWSAFQRFIKRGILVVVEQGAGRRPSVYRCGAAALPDAVPQGVSCVGSLDGQLRAPHKKSEATKPESRDPAEPDISGNLYTPKERRELIVKLLAEKGPMTPGAIAASLKMDTAKVYSIYAWDPGKPLFQKTPDGIALSAKGLAFYKQLQEGKQTNEPE